MDRIFTPRARRIILDVVLFAWLVGFVLIVLLRLAYAADDTTVAVAPLYKILEPYLVTVVGLLVSAALGWIGLLIKARLGVDLDANMQKTIQDAATNAAGALIARMEGPIGSAKIDVRSQIVKDGVDMLVAKVPDAIAHFGLTPDALARIVQGKIGILQAQAAAPGKSA